MALLSTTAEPGVTQAWVPNPSFEANTGIPTAYGQVALAAPWSSPTISSPDYFHSLAPVSSGVGVPANDFGNQAPLTGRAYGGFHARPVNQYREYVETPLASPLVGGQTYQVSFAVSLADQSRWAVDRIGAFLSVGPVGPANTAYVLPHVPQINHPSGVPITNKASWTLVTGTYTAAGGEDHIVIGNFYDNPSTTPVVVPGGAYPFAYYYVDDVSVESSAPCAAPPADMVAWYPLDEPSGAISVDDVAPPPGSAVNNVGVAQPGPVGPPGPGSGPVPVVGQVSGAHYFHPGHFHAVAPHAELDFGTGDFSIDAWIRAVGNAVSVQAIVDKLDIPGGNTGFALYVQDRYLKLDMNGTTIASATQITGGNPMANTGPWFHVAATVDRTAGVGVLYLDGVPSGPAFSPPATSVTNGLPLWIGETRLPNSVGEIAIDELELFDRALSPSEVMALYQAGPAGKCKPDAADLGDAPDSTNHAGTTMFSYAVANFPTVFDPPAPGPAGPVHRFAKALLWLGADVSLEGEADQGWDQDPTANLLPGASPPSYDHDLLDDGVATVPLPDCAVTQFPFDASNAAPTALTGYVNVWFDWTRDGDWDDLPRCAVAPNVDAIAPEWAVQNQAVSLVPGFNAALASAPFRAVNPAPGRATWMRISLTDIPIVPASHGGPFPNPSDLGRGGSGPIAGYRFGETEDYHLDGASGRAEICVTKFHDLDGDGAHDPGEPGLPGWAIDVVDAGGTVVATMTTGPLGTRCAGLPAPAPYTVAETLQAGWTRTFPPPPGTHAVNLAPGQVVNLAFGNRRITGPIFLPGVLRRAVGFPTPVAATTGAPTAEPTVPGISTPPGAPTPKESPSASPTAAGDPSPTATTHATATRTDRPTATTHATATPTDRPSATASPTATLSPTAPSRPTATPTAGPARPTPGCVPAPAAMSAWWPLDEVVGLTVRDAVGARDGVVLGGSAVVDPAKVAAGRTFDGRTGHILVDDDAALDPGEGDFSLDAWIRPDALDGQRPVLSKTHAPADAPLGYALTLEAGRPSLSMWNETSALSVTATVAVPGDGEWHLVAATVERGSPTGGHLYLDGAAIHTFDTSSLVGAVDTTAALLIGSLPARGRGLPARFFGGGIDEVEVFGRALGAHEVAAIFHAGAFGKCGKR